MVWSNLFQCGSHTHPSQGRLVFGMKSQFPTHVDVSMGLSTRWLSSPRASDARDHKMEVMVYFTTYYYWTSHTVIFKISFWVEGDLHKSVMWITQFVVLGLHKSRMLKEREREHKHRERQTQKKKGTERKMLDNIWILKTKILMHLWNNQVEATKNSLGLPVLSVTLGTKQKGNQHHTSY